MAGFCGTGFSRTDFAFGLAWYLMLYCPEENERLNRVGRRFNVQLGVCACLESEEFEVKRAFGAIVRSRPMPNLMVGWGRFVKRMKHHGLAVPSWPGTWNMPTKGSEYASSRAWMRSVGIDPDAVELFAPRGEWHHD